MLYCTSGIRWVVLCKSDDALLCTLAISKNYCTQIKTYAKIIFILITVLDIFISMKLRTVLVSNLGATRVGVREKVEDTANNRVRRSRWNTQRMSAVNSCMLPHTEAKI